MKHKTIIRALALVFLPAILGVLVMARETHAATVGFSMSPMKQSIVLNPGDVYQTSISITSSGSEEKDTPYSIRVVPFYVNDDYNTVFEENESYNLIVDWITLDVPDSGVLKPHETTDIFLTIRVPYDAPAGGQYASILVSSAGDDSDEGQTTINETVAIGHIIFAEVTGNTVKQGEFTDVSVPGMILDGNITASSSIKNTGNTHGTAKYKLQVFPLFSDEEVFSNEEEPETHIIIPDRVYYNETVWTETPNFGIFNVVYTVEYEGVVEQVSKMVVKCPVWIMFLVFFGVFAIIIWLYIMAKGRRRARR